MKVLSIANQKGGVGKTTTAVNIASCLAAAERRTLLIDLDPQGNASSGLGVNKQSLSLSIYDSLVRKEPLQNIIQKTALEFLDIAPSNNHLVGAELELVSAFSRESRLATAIQGLSDRYDYVLIDCPPSLNLLTVNAFAASDGIIVPVQCEYYALEGLTELVRTIQLIQDHLNPRLQIEGIVLTMYDARNNLARQVADEVRRYFPQKVYQTVIPRNVKLSESPSHGKSIILYDVQSKGAKSYLELTQEFLEIKNDSIKVQNISSKDFSDLGEASFKEAQGG